MNVKEESEKAGLKLYIQTRYALQPAKPNWKTIYYCVFSPILFPENCQ